LFTVLPYVRLPLLDVDEKLMGSGALGSGLAIFTKYPIISAEAHPYSLSGLPHHATAGDFFVNKAAGSIVVLHPYLGEVEVWSTHVSGFGLHEAGAVLTNRCTLLENTHLILVKRTESLNLGNWRI
jgi:sphingomyelin phosphodiesterase 2